MVVPTVSLEALTAAASAENRHAFRKIAACYRVHQEWVERDVKHKHYSRYGRTEMALALGCSATVAEAYVSVGVALHTRLPLLRAAFETGDIDLPRVRTACRILDNLSDTIVTSVEKDVVEAARRNSPGPLEKEIWDILLRVAPEEAAALREFAKRFRTVTYSPAGELARIRAELTAPEAAAAWQLLEEMADTLCPKDPRGKKERLCDAFMARMHGETHLVCLCQRTACPKAGAALPDRRVPLTMVTVDIATLIGLLANPAYLAGHGSIDPELARELARNSQWQILLTEAVTLAEKLGLAVQNPDTGEWERRPNPDNVDPATESETDKGSETATGSGTDSDGDPDSDGNADGDGNAATQGAADNASTPTPASTGPESPTAPTPTAPIPTAPIPTAPIPTAPIPTAPRPTLEPDPAATSDPGSDVVRGNAAIRASEGDTDSTCEPTSVEGPTPGTGRASAGTGDDPHQRRLQSLTSAAAVFCTHTPVGTGTRHSSALDLSAVTLTVRTLRSTKQTGLEGIHLGSASLAAAFEAAIAADPTLGHSIGRDPLTDRALIYRPDTLTAAAVRFRDRHCRFPGCQRPAERCQLDHITPFDHTNPLGGGWTTVGNLQCLCEFHHTVKTAGYWKATMLPGGAILWTSTSKTARITLPASGSSVPLLGNDLSPHIPTKPKRSGVIAYPNPPDSQGPEVDDTATPPF
ncbi:MAG: DUF222 domain-containing protein [Rhodococcus sp. (in: high G+C Gram-positive bacteria)]